MHQISRAFKQVLVTCSQLGTCLAGLERCLTVLTDPASRHEQQFSYVTMVLRDKVVDVFHAFPTPEQRAVLANKLARIK